MVSNPKRFYLTLTKTNEAGQIPVNEDLVRMFKRFMLRLVDIVNSVYSGEVIFNLFTAFVGLVADDYSKRTVHYLDALQSLSLQVRLIPEVLYFKTP